MSESAEQPRSFEALPGGDLVRQGLEDIEKGIESAPALLVRSFAPRLQRLGIDAPDYDPRDELPGQRLYKLLQESHGDGAHSRYNALMRRVVSFARAAECAQESRTFSQRWRGRFGLEERGDNRYRALAKRYQ